MNNKKSKKLAQYDDLMAVEARSDEEQGKNGTSQLVTADDSHEL